MGHGGTEAGVKIIPARGERHRIGDPTSRPPDTGTITQDPDSGETRAARTATMSGLGDRETERLAANVKQRLGTLLQQLDDVEQMREELDDDEEEYETLKRETLAQLEELRASLKRLTGGDAAPADELGSLRLGSQAASRVRSTARAQP